MPSPMTYRRAEPSTGWTRIDLLLALYDGALERLDRADAAIRAGNTRTAVPLVARAQLIVVELARGVRIDVNPEMGHNMLRLYEFIAHELRDARPAGIANARRILTTLREGFQSIRVEATALERSGQLPSAERLQMLHALA